MMRGMKWKPIETCPLHTEVLFYREDAGVLFGSFSSLDGLLTNDELEKLSLSEDEIYEPDYWAHLAQGMSRCDGDLKPTHWMPLPKGPEGVA